MPGTTRFAAVDVRHDIVQEGVCLAAVEQREDVRMVETGRELDLAQEPLRSERSREVGVEYLERNDPVVPAILREIYGRHASAPELAIDGIGAFERRS